MFSADPELGPRLRAGRHADERLLRRRSQGRQPVRRKPARHRRGQRQAACGISRACTTDLWDYDFPAAPTLVDITVDGKRIKAVAQVSKQGFTYVFDRATGKPVWPIEERPVPQSTVPGEKTSPTQPFPTKPPPFARQGITADDLIDFTPELRAEALQIASEYTLGPLFTPPTVVGENGKKGVLQMPSAAGGANWGGAASIPKRVAVRAILEHLVARWGCAGRRGKTASPRTRFVARLVRAGPRGLPLIKPPYGVVTAIDLNKGEIAWQVPHGDGPRDHPHLKGLNLPPLGASSHTFLSSGGPLVTKTLLFINQVQTRPDGRLSSTEFFMRAFDKKTGAVVWEYRMTEPPFGTPMTYLHGGRQYIVVATGGAACRQGWSHSRCRSENVESETMRAMSMPGSCSSRAWRCSRCARAVVARHADATCCRAASATRRRRNGRAR